MTNVEKFKEIFDIEVVPENTCLSESCLCHECSHHNGTRCHVEDWWYADYQGEPTIPSSAIEDIKAEITGNLETIIGKYDSNTKPEDMPSRKFERNNGRIEAIDIINRKIAEVKGDKA